MTHVVEQSPASGARAGDDRRWAAVLARDGRFDGWFYYSVATTGVYCRPSCPVRAAKRAHVRFHATPAEAEAAGFRPCQRCRPDQPARHKPNGVGERLNFAIGACSLGSILVAASDKGVRAVMLGDDPEGLARELWVRFPSARLVAGDVRFERLVAKVIARIEAPGQESALPLDVRGTAFQQRVWRALRDIPAGTTASYAEIAQRIGQPKAVRAVAQACGANPLPVIIPCHRVVRNDGALSGYRWGVARKRALLQRERRP